MLRRPFLFSGVQNMDKLWRRVSLNDIYWQAYDHGTSGGPRRNLFAGEQSNMYNQGYLDGLDVYESTRDRLNDPTAKPHGPQVIRQILAFRDEIDVHKAEIRRLEDIIKELDS